MPRRDLSPGACYSERTFASHPWILTHIASVNKGTDEDVGNDSARGCSTSAASSRIAAAQQMTPLAEAEFDQDLCVVRVGDEMVVSRLSETLIWNPAAKSLSLMRQAKVGLPSASPENVTCLALHGEGAGIAPGKRRLCMVGTEREDERCRRAAQRARIRRAKVEILQHMASWRMHPPDGIDLGTRSSRAGIGQGVPHVRFVMVGQGEGLVVRSQASNR